MKKITIIVIALALALNLFSPVSAEHTPEEDLLRYTALILGVNENSVLELYTDYNGDQDAFLAEVNTILEDIVYSEQWDTAIKTDIDLDQFSQQYHVNRNILSQHLNITGSDYFLRNLSSQQQASTYSSGSGSSTGMSAEFFYNMCYVAHEGNIFLTKDNINLGYRHGHVGIISNHDSTEDATTKMIAEAVGPRDDEEDEVVNQELSNWADCVTLAIYYPNDIDTSQREYAGYMGTQFDYCGYKSLIKKGNAADELPYVNCISLVYLAYMMSNADCDYDLIPQTGSSSYLYPSQIQFSTIIMLKTLADGSMARTSNWNNYDWGFN